MDGCNCKETQVIIDPVNGGGSFDIRSGLYLDKFLETKLPEDIPLRVGIDRLFVGMELMQA